MKKIKHINQDTLQRKTPLPKPPAHSEKQVMTDIYRYKTELINWSCSPKKFWKHFWSFDWLYYSTSELTESKPCSTNSDEHI